jgi:ATP-dependent Clp protease ATP-binding subunit ClpX
MQSNSLPVCGQCGKNQNEVKNMYGVGKEFVCGECATLMHNHTNGIEEVQPIDIDLEQFKPSIIKSGLDDYIIGQERAKKLVAIAAYNHIKRIKTPVIDGVEIRKSNVLLVGPTGCGKTLIAEVLAKLLGLPLFIADSTNKTASGYVGEDVETILGGLLDKAGGDIQKAQNGIVFLDEVDKLSRKSENPSITRDVSGEDVQQSLLKILEGTEVEIAEAKRKHPNAKTQVVDTSNILFICGGSFAGIEQQIIAAKTEGNGIGFNGTPKSIEESKDFDYSQIDVEELKKFGMIPEFLGRLPVIAQMETLNAEALKSILTEPKNALLKQFQALFKQEDIELSFTDDKIDQFVQDTLKKGTGARGLRAVVEKEMEDVQFYAPDMDITEFVVGETELNHQQHKQKAA